MTSMGSVSRFRRFRALPPIEKWLLLEAWWRLLVAAVSLRLRPGSAVAHAMRPAVRLLPGSGKEVSTNCLAEAVARAGAHHLWPMTCLPRALALRRMLERRGQTAQVVLGVRRNGRALSAHAWVEVDGQPLGEPEKVEERFLPLLAARGQELDPR